MDAFVGRWDSGRHGGNLNTETLRTSAALRGCFMSQRGRRENKRAQSCRRWRGDTRIGSSFTGPGAHFPFDTSFQEAPRTKADLTEKYDTGLIILLQNKEAALRSSRRNLSVKTYFSVLQSLHDIISSNTTRTEQFLSERETHQDWHTFDQVTYFSLKM